MRARLPPELHEAARAARRILGINMTNLIRAGICAQLVEAARKCAEIARSPNASAYRRIQAVEFIRQARFAEVSMVLPVEDMERYREEALAVEKLCRRRRRQRVKSTESDRAPRPLRRARPQSESAKRPEAEPGLRQMRALREQGR